MKILKQSGLQYMQQGKTRSIPFHEWKTQGIQLAAELRQLLEKISTIGKDIKTHAKLELVKPT